MQGNYDFTLIKTTDYDAFCRDVRDRLNDSWQLHGNTLAISSGDGSVITYLQAMVKDVRNSSSVGFRRSM